MNNANIIISRSIKKSEKKLIMFNLYASTQTLLLLLLLFCNKLCFECFRTNKLEKKVRKKIRKGGFKTNHCTA